MKKIILMAVFFIAAVTVFQSTTAQTAYKALPTTPPTLKLSDPLPANLFIELGKAINPAVVNISTSVIPKGRMYRDPMLEMLEQLYGPQPGYQTRPQGPPPSQAGRPQKMGLGTGFIIREDGLIVTNAHVINGADIIEVQLTENSDKLYKAELVGLDERTDIALIKIKPDKKLTAVVLGSSEDVQVGEWVAAFGNPFGHGHSMTKGIISSKGREIEEINRLPLLQTDASINPGNSGGPLVNAKGLVIGVNSAIDARAQGIGFAISIDEVKKILPQLEQRGSIRKGYLGVRLGDIDNQSAAQMGMPEYSGAVIMSVGDGPAKKAGLKMYDLVLEINGRKIKSSRELSDLVSAIEPGQKAKFYILRGEKKMMVDVTIAERPDEKFRQAKASEPEVKIPAVTGKKDRFSFGLEISDANSVVKDNFRLDDATRNPVVVSIANNSLAQKAGLKPGDVLLSINKKEPKSAAEANNLFKKGENTVRVGRGQGLSVMTFDIP
jgi:serine protease Do